jgi:tetratricopeptide (TPR) repeat protein
LDHPSRDELAVLSWGSSLSDKREKEVLRHLLVRRCPACLAAVPPRLSALLGLKRWRRRPTAEEVHDAATQRRAARPPEMERHLREQQAQADRGLKALQAGRELPREMGTLARMWALLDRSWELRYDDPQEMAFLAWSGTAVSLELDQGFYGRKRVRDFQARAEADLGNACRVAQRFGAAERTLWRARQLFEQGTGDALLEVRLLDYEASLLADRRRWIPAEQKLLQMLRFYEERDDLHLMGRTLVKLGLYAGYEGRYELAIQRLEQSLELIDAERDPSVLCSAAHNLILFSVDSGRIAEAKKLRIVHSRPLRHAGGRIGEIKFQILEGRIAFGEGNDERAETIFREVVDSLCEAGLPIIAGIEMLDLAVVLLRQGKAQEAERTVIEAVELFAAYEFEREALQAVVLLRDSFRLREATTEMVLEVADFVRRLMYEPALRFEARAWERSE